MRISDWSSYVCSSDLGGSSGATIHGDGVEYQLHSRPRPDGQAADRFGLEPFGHRQAIAAQHGGDHGHHLLLGETGADADPGATAEGKPGLAHHFRIDRKSTRLNSSH